VNHVSSRSAQTVSRRQRRGATLVLVVLSLTVLLGLSALAIDFARLYTGLNEMQTAADASALHGALLIQKSPKSNTIIADVTTFAKSYNRALGGPVDIVTVTPYHFETTVNKRKATAWGAADLNAVQVSVQRTSGLLMLAQLLNVVFPAPTRTATSWVANFTGNSCVRPWMIDMGRLINRADPTQPVTTRRALLPAESATLRPAGKVLFVLAPPGASNVNEPKYGSSYGGAWAALTPAKGSYSSAVNSCNGADALAVGDVLPVSIPGNVAGSTASSLLPQGNGNNADGTAVCTALLHDVCWKDGTLGGPVAMTYGYPTNSASAFAQAGANHSIELVGSFVVLCFKQPQPTNKKNLNVCDPTGFTAGLPTAGDWKNNVADGTMVGYVDFTPPPSFSGKFRLGTGAGTGSATQQRLILVDPTQP